MLRQQGGQRNQTNAQVTAGEQKADIAEQGDNEPEDNHHGGDATQAETGDRQQAEPAISEFTAPVRGWFRDATAHDGSWLRRNG